MRKTNLSAPKARILALTLCLISIIFIYYGIFFGILYGMDGPRRHTPSTMNNIAWVPWLFCIQVLIYVGIIGTIANLIASISNIFIKNYSLAKTCIHFSLFIIILSIMTAVFTFLKEPPIIYPIGG